MNRRNEKSNLFLSKLKNYNIDIETIKNLYVIYEELLIEEDKNMILNFNASNKEEYIRRIYKLKNEYKIIDYNDFVIEHKNSNMEELEKIITEMNNKRIHIDMIFDKDAISSDYEYVDWFFKNE